VFVEKAFFSPKLKGKSSWVREFMSTA